MLDIFYSFTIHNMTALEQQILGLLAMHPEGLSASELRTQVHPQVSQPTLWRRLDELRARGRIRKTGRGRATRYHNVTSGHAIADLRSKVLHLEVGKKLLRQPALLEQARARLEKMRINMPHAKAYVERWESLISGPIEAVLQVLGSDHEDDIALRHASPFAGMISEQERLVILRRHGLMR